MKSLLFTILSLASLGLHAQVVRDLRPHGGDHASQCRAAGQRCVLIRYTVEGLRGQRELLPQPLCAAVGRNLGGKDPLILRPEACSGSAVRTRFTRVPPPNMNERLTPSRLMTSVHRFMSGEQSWPSNVCWEVDVNGGYDFAQLIVNSDICSSITRVAAPQRVNNVDRGTGKDHEGDSQIQKASSGSNQQ